MTASYALSYVYLQSEGVLRYEIEPRTTSSRGSQPGFFELDTMRRASRVIERYSACGSLVSQHPTLS